MSDHQSSFYNKGNIKANFCLKTSEQKAMHVYRIDTELNFLLLLKMLFADGPVSFFH